jgi:anti-sigma regulatory factor (Ser/Thr protein kinase)/ABC-type transporter Mla MlaB component
MDDQPVGKQGYLSLQGDLRREVALAAVLPDANPDADELLITASGVQRVDAAAGSALRLAIERQIGGHDDRRIVVWAPSQPAPREQLIEMLTPLPDGVSLAGGSEAPGPARHVLMPATLVPDELAAVVAAGWALERCDEARISYVRANLVGLAVAELASNSLRHAQGTLLPPAITVTVSGRERTIEVAAVDLGTGISEAKSSPDLLAAIPDPTARQGFFADLIRRGNVRGLAIQINIMSGVGRLRWAWNGHQAQRSAYIPGTTVIVRILTSSEHDAE